MLRGRHQWESIAIYMDFNIRMLSQESNDGERESEQETAYARPKRSHRNWKMCKMHFHVATVRLSERIRKYIESKQGQV